MSCLILEQLSSKIGNFSLNNINLEINKNEYFVLLGQSGSGKTKLLESIAGINNCSGKLILNGENIIFKNPEKRDFGFVYQDFALFPNFNVKENIKFAKRYKKIEDEQAIYDDLVYFLKLEKLLNRSIENLSGGEKQRVALARALYSRPKVLLLDEPLGAIDPTFRNSIMKSLKDIHNRYNIATIHVTHNFREASYLADKIAIIINGKIEQVGAVSDVFNHPKSIEVAQFLGFKNVFPTSMLGFGFNSKFYSIDPNVIYISRENKLKTDFVFEGVLEECMGIIDHYKLFVKVQNYQFFIKIPKREYERYFIDRDDKILIGFFEKDLCYL